MQQMSPSDASDNWVIAMAVAVPSSSQQFGGSQGQDLRVCCSPAPLFRCQSLGLPQSHSSNMPYCFASKVELTKLCLRLIMKPQQIYSNVAKTIMQGRDEMTLCVPNCLNNNFNFCVWILNPKKE